MSDPRPAQGMGVCGVGVRGEPSSWRTRPDLCAGEGHPGSTFNPNMGKTWCLCGEVVVDGDTVDVTVASAAPLVERGCGDWSSEHDECNRKGGTQ